MYPFLLQDWITIQSSANHVTQSEPLWLDMSSYLDLVAWLEVKQVSGTFSLAYQTCPSKDDSLFQAMNDTTVGMAAGVQVAVLLRDTALCPLARWLRWKLLNTGGLASQATFRIWVAASQPGGYALEDLMADNAAYAGGPDYVQLGGGDTGGGPGPSGKLPTHLGVDTSLRHMHPRNLGAQSALQHNGPAPLPPRNLGAQTGFGHGVRMRQVDYSHPAALNHPRLHGMISTTIDPFWKRTYIKPVIGAFQDLHPINPIDPGPEKT